MSDQIQQDIKCNSKQHSLNEQDDLLGTQRVYKKSSSNGMLTLYLPAREISVRGDRATTLCGVLFLDEKLVENHRVYTQLTLTFRYGREDEEVMGLRFCNEAIMCLRQIYPAPLELLKPVVTHLQEALLTRLGEHAYPFTLELPPEAPPSVQLVPAKKYYGAPIGTSYDVRCFLADKTDEKLARRSTVKMTIRAIHYPHASPPAISSNSATLINSSTVNSNQPSPVPLEIPGPGAAPSTSSSSTTSSQTSSFTNRQYQRQYSKSERADSFSKLKLSPKAFRFAGKLGRSKSEFDDRHNDAFYDIAELGQQGPQVSVDKPFLLQEGKVHLSASLDKSLYRHGEMIIVTVNIKNDSRKTVRRIRVTGVQHVDVCMFNNGKFKNIVAEFDTSSSCEKIVGPGETFKKDYSLLPQRGVTKNWIALEDTLQRSNDPAEITGLIAVSAVRPFAATNSHEERNVFAIYVSYYVKVKLTLSGMGGELSLKLPFLLAHKTPSLTTPTQPVATTTTTTTTTATQQQQQQQSVTTGASQSHINTEGQLIKLAYDTEARNKTNSESKLSSNQCTADVSPGGVTTNENDDDDGEDEDELTSVEQAGGLPVMTSITTGGKMIIAADVECGGNSGKSISPRLLVRHNAVMGESLDEDDVPTIKLDTVNDGKSSPLLVNEDQSSGGGGDEVGEDTTPKSPDTI